MSEDEHRRMQNDEQSDDVEAHRKHAAANDEPTAEGEGGDDDFEAHRRHAAAPKKA
jgi:hypothetical protein